MGEGAPPVLIVERTARGRVWRQWRGGRGRGGGGLWLRNLRLLGEECGSGDGPNEGVDSGSGACEDRHLGSHCRSAELPSVEECSTSPFHLIYMLWAFWLGFLGGQGRTEGLRIGRSEGLSC